LAFKHKKINHFKM